MELEEFLLENAVAVVQPNQQMVEQKGKETNKLFLCPRAFSNI
jgi:hypothetical protein